MTKTTANNRSRHYTVHGLRIEASHGLWTLPALAADDCGLLSRQPLTLRVAEDGIACHPLTEGPGRDQRTGNAWPITRGERLRGWGAMDGESYRLGDHYLVPAAVLEALAEWAGLALPDN